MTLSQLILQNGMVYDAIIIGGGGWIKIRGKISNKIVLSKMKYRKPWKPLLVEAQGVKIT